MSTPNLSNQRYMLIAIDTAVCLASRLITRSIRSTPNLSNRRYIPNAINTAVSLAAKLFRKKAIEWPKADTDGRVRGEEDQA